MDRTFCTAQTGMTRKAWIVARIAAVQTVLGRKGIGVGPDLLKVYRSFLAPGERMTLSMAPDNPVNLATLRL